MYKSNLKRGFSLGRNTQTAATAIVSLIEPYPGAPNAAPFLYSALSGKANWLDSPNYGVTHITDISVLAGSTAHQFYILRPLNWTTFAEAATANDTTFVVSADPGVYSTNYRYPTPGGLSVALGGAPPIQVANNVAAGGDYVAWQYDDGSWDFDTIASVASLTWTMTTGTKNRTGATVAAGRPIFFFGIFSDGDPATGQLHVGFDTIVSTRNIWQSTNGLGIVTARHQGDPMLFFDANGTAADFLNVLAGFYADE